MHSERLGLPAQKTDRHQLLEEIDIQSQHMRRACDIVVGEENRITVRSAFDRGVDADRATGAGAVLNEHLLAQLAGQMLADDTSHKIKTAASCERYDETHRPVRPHRVVGRSPLRMGQIGVRQPLEPGDQSADQ